MRVFVTGATGFIGAGIVRELLAAGHTVLGLVRTATAATALLAMGAEAHIGTLEDRRSLRRGAERCEGVIHTAFKHDFANLAASCEMDREVILDLGAALAGSGRPLVVSSAIGVLPHGQLAMEDSRPASGAGRHPRAASEEAVDRLVDSGVHAMAVRLAPSVHGVGDHGFVPRLIDTARRHGVSATVREGTNRWPAVHRDDAARLFRRVLESGDRGARYHAVAESGVAFRAIAEAIAVRLAVPLVDLSEPQARAHFGWMAHFAAMDIPVSSEWTQDTLAWRPSAPSLLADFDLGGYFRV